MVTMQMLLALALAAVVGGGLDALSGTRGIDRWFVANLSSSEETAKWIAFAVRVSLMTPCFLVASYVVEWSIVSARLKRPATPARAIWLGVADDFIVAWLIVLILAMISLAVSNDRGLGTWTAHLVLAWLASLGTTCVVCWITTRDAQLVAHILRRWRLESLKGLLGRALTHFTSGFKAGQSASSPTAPLPGARAPVHNPLVRPKAILIGVLVGSIPFALVLCSSK